jgi:hypothetical protein
MPDWTNDMGVPALTAQLYGDNIGPAPEDGVEGMEAIPISSILHTPFTDGEASRELVLDYSNLLDVVDGQMPPQLIGSILVNAAAEIVERLEGGPKPVSIAFTFDGDEVIIDALFGEPEDVDGDSNAGAELCACGYPLDECVDRRAVSMLMFIGLDDDAL